MLENISIRKIKTHDYFTKSDLFLYWEEHCTECAVPSCFQTCALYEDRQGFSCRRFEKGLTVNDSGIQFYKRRWGKLEAKNRFINKSKFLINLLQIAETTIFSVPHIQLKKGTRHNKFWLNQKIKYFIFKGAMLDTDLLVLKLNGEFSAKSQLSLNLHFKGDIETKFLLTGDLSFPLTSSLLNEIDRFSIDSVNGDIEGMVTIRKLEFTRGWRSLRKAKVFVWDLDNTLWRGILIEGRIELRTEIIEIIRFLDSVGVINSICSKNDYNEAMEKLDELGISDLFVFPEINWNLKTKNLKRISENLNISFDQMVFIDDNLSERFSVASQMLSKGLRIMDENEIVSSFRMIPLHEDTLGSQRRMSYLSEMRRINFLSEESNYSEIDNNLLRLNTRLELVELSERSSREIQDRALELLQRSNQLNLKTIRYSEEGFHALLMEDNCFVFKVKDSFGDYGWVGFASMSLNDGCFELTNLVVSCRVARKGIEALIISKMLEILGDLKDNIRIELIRNERNGLMYETLKGMEFDFHEELEGSLKLISSAKNFIEKNASNLKDLFN